MNPTGLQGMAALYFLHEFQPSNGPVDEDQCLWINEPLICGQVEEDEMGLACSPNGGK
jgi:hypothetical protein